VLGAAVLLAGVRLAGAAELRVASGVVPHHGVAGRLIAAFYERLASLGSPETIVLVSPDHFKAASVTGQPLTSVEPEDAASLGITVDAPLLAALRRRVSIGTSLLRVAGDHGVTVQLAYLKRRLPSARIVPLLVAGRTTRATLDRLARELLRTAGPRAMVIASVDFSHYLPREAAALHDVKSLRVLLDLERDAFPGLEVDSWQALYLARLYARLRAKETPLLVGAANALDFLAGREGESTTSYLSVLFTAGAASPIERGRSLLLLGDILLDRKVKAQMRARGELWPFEPMRQLLRGIDLVLANLEGPVVRRKVVVRPQRFGFAPRTAALLASMNVNLLSLANNHTLDQGRPGLEETRRHLAGARVAFVGDPERCGADAAREARGVLVLAFNLVGGGSCSNAALARAVKRARASRPGRFTIVTLHWGSEYIKTHNWWQEELAHALIDAGADLVAGHHPHVVQDLELYRDRLIVYSLGNFIFDQYAMADTEEGLAVGVASYPGRTEVRLFPLRSRRSQPALMARRDAELFLSELAGRSSPELRSGIRRGKIVLTAR
jgi:poly-gamma-glutamate synthesis protein (capsule biosynthesis protein)